MRKYLAINFSRCIGLFWENCRSNLPIHMVLPLPRWIEIRNSAPHFCKFGWCCTINTYTKRLDQDKVAALLLLSPLSHAGALAASMSSHWWPLLAIIGSFDGLIKCWKCQWINICSSQRTKLALFYAFWLRENSAHRLFFKIESSCACWAQLKLKVLAPLQCTLVTTQTRYTPHPAIRWIESENTSPEKNWRALRKFFLVCSFIILCH